MMSDVLSKTPVKDMKHDQDAVSNLNVSDTVDLHYAVNIDWTSKKGLYTALKYHFHNNKVYYGLYYY